MFWQPLLSRYRSVAIVHIFKFTEYFCSHNCFFIIFLCDYYIFRLQIPYLILSSIAFVIPYFFIVGFDKGDVAAKFFWYWLIQGLYMSTMVFLGHFLSAALPSGAVANGT
jgi:hypothetical protein